MGVGGCALTDSCDSQHRDQFYEEDSRVVFLAKPDKFDRKEIDLEESGAVAYYLLLTI